MATLSSLNNIAVDIWLMISLNAVRPFIAFLYNLKQ